MWLGGTGKKKIKKEKIVQPALLAELMGKINKFELRKKVKILLLVWHYWNAILNNFMRFGEEQLYLHAYCLHRNELQGTCPTRELTCCKKGLWSNLACHCVKKKKAQTKCLITPSFTRALTEGTQTKGSRCWVGGVGVWESSHLSENPSQESRPFWAETETKNSGCIWPKTKTENAFYFTYIFILYNCINIRRFNEIE